MLLKIEHIPRLYTDTPQDPDQARRYTSLLLALLQDATSNCVLYVDDSDVIFGAIQKGLKKWPQKHRLRALQLVKMLEQNNRIIRVPVTGGNTTCCGQLPCQYALGIAIERQLDLVVGFDRCQECSTLGSRNIEMIDVDDYFPSSFRELRRKAESIEIADGAWDKALFEERVWKPLFQHAKHVKLYDRIFGHHVTKGLSHGQPIPAGITLRIEQHFLRGIEWILEQFAAATSARTVRHFEITCGLDARLHPSVRRAAAQALRGFADTCSVKYGFKIVVNVKLETKTSKLRHARFLFTDQVALLVERGFDLLRDDGKVRDVVIKHIDNPGIIESDIRALDDVE